MSDEMKSNLPNADMQGAPRALLRAARRAREIARQTNTGIIMVRDGVIVEVPASELEPESDEP
jgi:hypothetical protein